MALTEPRRSSRQKANTSREGLKEEIPFITSSSPSTLRTSTTNKENKRKVMNGKPLKGANTNGKVTAPETKSVGQ